MTSYPSRRTVAKGAAWSLPAIVVSVPAAAYAATNPQFNVHLSLSSACVLTAAFHNASSYAKVIGYTAYLDGQQAGDPVTFPVPIEVDPNDSNSVTIPLPDTPGTQYSLLCTVTWDWNDETTVEPADAIDISACYA